MADFWVDNAKDTVGYYLSLPAANDALLVVPLKAAGLAADSVLMVRTTFAGVMANAVEQTAMGRKTITSTTRTVDNTNHRVDITFTPPTWTKPTGDAISKLLLCYDPDVTMGTDADLRILGFFDTRDNAGNATVFAPDGVSDFPMNLLSAAGFYRVA